MGFEFDVDIDTAFVNAVVERHAEAQRAARAARDIEEEEMESFKHALKAEIAADFEQLRIRLECLDCGVKDDLTEEMLEAVKDTEERLTTRFKTELDAFLYTFDGYVHERCSKLEAKVDANAAELEKMKKYLDQVHAALVGAQGSLNNVMETVMANATTGRSRNETVTDKPSSLPPAQAVPVESQDRRANANHRRQRHPPQQRRHPRTSSNTPSSDTP